MIDRSPFVGRLGKGPGKLGGAGLSSGALILLSLKVSVSLLTTLLLGSLAALARGNYRLHGRLNLAFFALTLTALLALEVLARVVRPSPLEAYLHDGQTLQALRVHLAFSVPAALMLPAMLYTGLTHRRGAHLCLAAVFGVLWTGTFITGIFFLPTPAP